MVPSPSVETVEQGDDYIHVRFRDPDEFDEIRTPDWAANAARSVSEGSEVRTGQRTDGDEWEVQSVLIPDRVDEDRARQQAERIYEEIES